MILQKTQNPNQHHPQPYRPNSQSQFKAPQNISQNHPQQHQPSSQSNFQPLFPTRITSNLSLHLILHINSRARIVHSSNSLLLRCVNLCLLPECISSPAIPITTSSFLLSEQLSPRPQSVTIQTWWILSLPLWYLPTSPKQDLQLRPLRQIHPSPRHKAANPKRRPRGTITGTFGKTSFYPNWGHKCKN